MTGGIRFSATCPILRIRNEEFVKKYFRLERTELTYDRDFSVEKANFPQEYFVYSGGELVHFRRKRSDEVSRHIGLVLP